MVIWTNHGDKSGDVAFAEMLLESIIREDCGWQQYNDLLAWLYYSTFSYQCFELGQSGLHHQST